MVTPANFPGNVTCTPNSDKGDWAGYSFIPWNQGGNATTTWDGSMGSGLKIYYGYGGTNVWVTCNGVTGTLKW